MNTNTFAQNEALDTKIQAGKFLTSLLESDITRDRMTLKKNDKIELTSTNNTPYIFVIVSGVAGIFSSTNVAIDFAGEGDLLDYNVYSSQLFGKALTDEVTVWRFAQSDVFNKIAASSEIQLQHYHMLQTIQRRLEKKQIQATLDMKNRIAAFIHTLATRYNPKADDQGMIELPRYFSRKMIANYAGISLSTLTTHLQQLMEEDRVIFNKRVLLISEENEA
ncbi:Crp/Fnr family transcriptional regulator [Listeria grandensis]|uniref:Crp/Fnr family transcriptional regulator n=1 Tax=Listeria grandensis TaxID=1494963 RepID=A0A7X1CPP4_9LIST|nr:Crp/Fnr family transcriptional regulator [Listeria grandensis]MBC1936205.1 Crp/Fnr family transcriptional regulator [Listeria grandensis]